MQGYFRSKIIKTLLPKVNSAQAIAPFNIDSAECKKTKVKVKGSLEVELDTVIFLHKNKSDTDAKNERCYILHFFGSGADYENEECKSEMLDGFLNQNANVIGFNYRGIGLSSGKVLTQDHLIEDGIAQVQNLLDSGVPSEKIVLKGHSLGGAVATLVAKHFHDIGKPVYLFNEKSFSSASKVVVGRMRQASFKNGHEEKFLPKIYGQILFPFIKVLLNLLNWEINAAKAYKEIPSKYKSYLVVRSPKSMRGNRTDDAIIPHYASLHKGLSKKDRKVESKVRTVNQTENGHGLGVEIEGDSLFKNFLDRIFPIDKVKNASSFQDLQLTSTSLSIDKIALIDSDKNIEKVSKTVDTISSSLPAELETVKNSSVKEENQENISIWKYTASGAGGGAVIGAGLVILGIAYLGFSIATLGIGAAIGAAIGGVMLGGMALISKYSPGPPLEKSKESENNMHNLGAEEYARKHGYERVPFWENWSGWKKSSSDKSQDPIRGV